MSELREILTKIDLEIESMKQTQGYAITARHDIIQHKLETLSLSYNKMLPIIGEANAVAVVNRAMERLYDVIKEQEQ